MNRRIGDPALVDEPFVVAFETGDQTAVPIVEALLREIDIPFTWKDVGLSAARQGGGYQLYGAALYQLLVRQSDAPDAVEALQGLNGLETGGSNEQANEETGDDQPVAYHRRRIAKWGIGVYLGAIVVILSVLGIVALVRMLALAASKF